MNEKITIIIPIYNVEKYLKQCIESVINQTYKNLEIILVDDGSPDNCGKICDEYQKKDTRIKVIHKKNGGLSSARNAGLDIATGEYYSFIDSDDFVSLEFIERLYELCKINNADISECDFQKFENDLLVEKKPIEVMTIDSNEMQNNFFSDNYLKTVVVWNKLYKRYIYESIRFPEGKINEDEFSSYKAYYNCKGNIVISNEKMYYYRYNSQSIMGRKFNVNRLDVLEAWKEQKDFYLLNKEYELYEKAIIRNQNRFKEYYILTFKNIENSEKYLDRIKKDLILNNKEYLKLKNVKLTKKLKMLFFCCFPNFYCNLIKLKDKDVK